MGNKKGILILEHTFFTILLSFIWTNMQDKVSIHGELCIPY